MHSFCMNTSNSLPRGRKIWMEATKIFTHERRINAFSIFLFLTLLKIVFFMSKQEVLFVNEVQPNQEKILIELAMIDGGRKILGT